MNKVIGILAHVDSGKTTLCEQILYHTKSIRKRGRVDHKDSYFDSYDIERQRGITIFSKEGKFSYNNSNYYLIDTPGHVDFSTEMERSLKMLDYAILIISGVEKVQSHSETIFNLLRENNIPTFIFINKMDREITNKQDIIEDLQENLSKNIFDFTNELKDEMSNELIEFISEKDEELLELFFEEKYNYDLWIKYLIKLIKELKVFPCVFGSALLDENIDILLEILDKLTITNYKKEDNFVGKVYKIKYEENNQKLTLIKLLQGQLKVKDEVSYKYNNEVVRDKINEIRVYNGEKFTKKDIADAGEIVAVKGLSKINVGQQLVSYNNEDDFKIVNDNNFHIIPTLSSKVIFAENLNIKDIYNYFKILENEEPSLNILYNEELKEIQISVMGKMQLEILKKIVYDRFSVEVDFGPCEILYKESIKSTAIGIGHFEPLKHYAEVVLKLEPSKRNSGIYFESKAHVDDITIGHQNLVRTHIFEKPHKGILGGYEIADIKVTLLTGRSHNKHTEGGDFRQATLRALRQGLETVENILLEPYYQFKIEIENEYIGRLISDIQKMSGTFHIQEGKNNRSIVNGRGPVSRFMDYPLELISYTKGRGRISFIYDGYDECHNTEDVLASRNYDKDNDKEYTSNSIFCSKGKGYIVKGEDVIKHMHCEIN